MVDKAFFLCVLILLGTAFAQEIVVTTKDGEKKKIPIKVVKSEETGRVIAPSTSPASEANTDTLNLMDLEGNKVNILLDRVTVIEYWSEENNGENLYWNKMRELEQKHADSSEIQFISINYDYVKTGKHHRESVKKYLNRNSAPKTVYLDMDDGFRDVFHIPGPVAYLLIDHRKQYTNVGRGDDPTTLKLFDSLIENALQYQKRLKTEKQQ